MDDRRNLYRTAHHRRDLPEFKREILRKWFESRGRSRVVPADARREVVLYPDAYTNHV
jgi:hypothetical protein